MAAQKVQEAQEQTHELRERYKTFSEFVKGSWHILEPTAPYIHNWHIDAIGEHLHGVNRGEIPRLRINQPPGTMKSLTVAAMFGAWEWGPMGMPGLRYLTTSYKPDYAVRDSRKMLELVQSAWYRTLWPDIVLTRTSQDSFENTYKGNRQAMPFNSLTGERGNRALLDDPHSTETAESDNDRFKTTRKFREGLTSRLNDPARDAIIVMMQRLHPEDICGVIEELGLPYVSLILPMEYVRSLVVKTPFYTDPRTEDGELLHPARFPREKVEALKIELGPHAYDTQYQQQPRARSGSYFFNREDLLIESGTKENPTYAPAPKPILCDAVFGVVDTATKVGKKRDGSGVQFYAYTRHPKVGGVMLDWEIVQIEADLLINWLPGLIRQGEQLAKECGARGGFLGLFIEDKDSGQALLQGAKRAGLKVHALDSKWAAAGKDARAVSCGGYVRKGMMKMSQHAYDKTMQWRGRTANHALVQITTYRMGIGTANDSDEHFDCWCYGNLVAFGSAKDL